MAGRQTSTLTMAGLAEPPPPQYYMVAGLLEKSNSEEKREENGKRNKKNIENNGAENSTGKLHTHSQLDSSVILTNNMEI